MEAPIEEVSGKGERMLVGGKRKANSLYPPDRTEKRRNARKMRTIGIFAVEPLPGGMYISR